MFNKKGGTSRNLGAKRPYKGYGIVMYEFPWARNTVDPALFWPREPILPIKSDSSDDDDDVGLISDGVQQLRL